MGNRAAMTAEDLTDWLETTIDDSFDQDWTSRDAAKLIVSRMQAEGLVMAHAQPASGDVVAWGIYSGPKLGWSIFSIPTVGSDGSQAVPLYAAPAQPAADLVEENARLRDTPNSIWAEAHNTEWDAGFNHAVKLFRQALGGEHE